MRNWMMRRMSRLMMRRDRGRRIVGEVEWKKRNKRKER